MDQLEYPSEEDWLRRREWFEKIFDMERRAGNCFFLSEQALGLLIDLQAVYCSGAFISCIILSCAVADAHIREVELGNDFEGGMKSAFETSRYSDGLDWLRQRRNRLVHFKEGLSAISVDMQYGERLAHELEAQRAIELAANVIFENPGT